MSKFYSQESMLDILKQLGIRPTREGAISTREAAQVLTWRAEHEYSVPYTYDETAVRSRVHSNSLQPIGGRNPNNRYNLYKFEDVFALPLYPRRGAGQKREEAVA